MQTVLEETAVSTPAFTITTTGIGIFPGEFPVLYNPIARTPQLQALHCNLYPKLDSVSEGALDYYNPQNWFPHITLGHSDITSDNLGEIVTWLNTQSLAWDVQVANLTLLHDNGKQLITLHRTELTA